jgi:hypothetical protein
MIDEANFSAPCRYNKFRDERPLCTAERNAVCASQKLFKDPRVVYQAKKNWHMNACANNEFYILYCAGEEVVDQAA